MGRLLWMLNPKQQARDENYEEQKNIILFKLQTSSRTKLQYVPKVFRADKDVVLAACRLNGSALQFASAKLKADKEVVLEACRQRGQALEYASAELKADREIALVACQQNGGALKFTSSKLKADKEVVMAAAASNPDTLKVAKGGLSQNPDCLRAARVWDDWNSYEKAKMRDGPKIVLSTRYSLKPSSRSQATTFPVLLKENEYIQNNICLIYSPNAFAKDTCDPKWTRQHWPCRGTFDTCKKSKFLKTGDPQPASCWRYSFRYQLERAKETRGCMIQLVERENLHSRKQSLGNGQKIETEMANDVGTKIFRVYALGGSRRFDEEFTEAHIELVASKLREWYADGCEDMSECVIAFNDDYATKPCLLNTVEMRERGLIGSQFGIFAQRKRMRWGRSIKIP